MAVASRPTVAAAPHEPLRVIGLYAATAITVGNIVGSGIFRSPNSVAQEVAALPWVILAWVIGGVLSICGSLVLTELAVTRPKTGGLYVFIREGFGNGWGFVFGWASLWVIKPTVIASITSVFALYFCQVMGLPKGAEFAVGAGAILLLTFINALGVREGAGTQSLFTTAKVAGILMLCAAAFLLPSVHPAAPVEAVTSAFEGGRKTLMAALAAAMIPILFAYDGWTDSTYVGGEVKNPRRNLPIAILGGTWLVIGLYVLVNLAYYRVLSPGEVASYEAVGSETVHRLLGDWGARALAVLVAVSTFGTTNGAILTGPRVTQAMAADGLLWRPMSALSPRGTPTLALWVQAGLSCAWLYAANGFEDVSGWFVTTSWLFYGITTLALFAQRRRGVVPAPGEYRTLFYPLTPIVFVLVTAAIIWADFSSSAPFASVPLPRAAAGVLIAALGFPVYWLWKGRSRR
jgi:APA family basic amino acid/polyamine antiporter